jgi:iron complex outermembrane receptor protein
MRQLARIALYSTSALFSLASLTPLAAAQAPASAAAAEASEATTEEGGMLGDIVVTANRRDQNIQKVGIAITAYSGDQLRELGVRETTDIAALSPGVSLSGASAGQQLMFNIRGVTQQDYSDFGESPNAVYLDEGYIVSTKAQRMAAFDLERVEVLMGPQGTLFGRNATGGLVHFISNKPEQTFGGYTEVSYGSYNNLRSTGAITGPIGGNGLAARASYYVNRHDNILKNNLPGADGEWNDDTIAGRLQLSGNLGSNADFLLEVHGGRQITSTAPYQSYATTPIFDASGTLVNIVNTSPTETRLGIGPNGENVCSGCFYGPGISGETRPVAGADAFGNVDADGLGTNMSKDWADSDGSRYSMYGAIARLHWTVGDVDLVSVTDVKQTKQSQSLDVDSTPTNQIVYFSSSRTRQVSEEFRASGSTGRLNWIAGAYFLTYKVDPIRVSLAFPETTLGGDNVLAGIGYSDIDYATIASLKATTYSIFGQTEFAFTDRLKLTTGLRGLIEKKHFNHRNDIYEFSTGDLIQAGFLPATTLNLKSKDKLWSARAALDWQATDDVLGYLSFNRGVKAGSFNQNAAGFGSIPPTFDYKPETLLAYEAGIKATLFDRKLRANASIFYYDYKDYQAYRYVQLQNYVVNLDAVNKGGEISLTGNPIPGLDLFAGLSYIDAKVKKVPFSANGGVVYIDREATFTPKWKASGLARYEWAVGTGKQAALQLNGTYSGGQWNSLTNYDASRAKGFMVFDGRASFKIEDPGVEFAIGVQNIFDKKNYNSIIYDETTICGCTLRSRGLPRWWNVSARYDW